MAIHLLRHSLNRLSRVGSTLLFCGLGLVASCAPRTVLSGTAGSALPSPSALLPLQSLQAAGNLDLVLNRERMLFKISAIWHGDSAFVCDIHTAWGGLAATIETDGSGGSIEAAGSSYTVGFDQPLTDFQFLPAMPFRFRELIRIITGSYAFDADTRGKPDTILIVDKKAILRWSRNGRIIEARYNRAASQIDQVAYTPMTRENGSWVLSFDRFRRHCPTRVAYILDKNNSFSLSWERFRPIFKQE